jgi:hypothetical protein
MCEAGEGEGELLAIEDICCNAAGAKGDGCCQS